MRLHREKDELIAILLRQLSISHERVGKGGWEQQEEGKQEEEEEGGAWAPRASQGENAVIRNQW